MHWPMLQYRERYQAKMPPRLLKGIEDGAHITQETYRAALLERDRLRAMHEDLAKRPRQVRAGCDEPRRCVRFQPIG